MDTTRGDSSMHVTLVGGFDSRFPSAGGVRPYVKALARYLESSGIPYLVVTSGSVFETGNHSCAVPVRRPGSTFEFMSSLSANLRRLPIPHDSIIHVQRPDYLLPFLAGGMGNTSVCTVHGNPFVGMKWERSLPVFAAYSAIEWMALSRFDRVIFVDAEAAAQYAARYPWVEPSSRVIPNGVDTDVFRPGDRTTERSRWDLGGKTFLYAGRLEPEKRVAEIVDAFREMGERGSLLVIAGDGRDRRSVEQAAHGANVRFLGPISHPDMPSLMNAVDALVMYSTREGVPATALEALACGTPVIATPVGALPDLLRSRRDGILVSSRKTMAEAMRAVCDGELVPNPEISGAVQRYSWSTLGPEILGVYRDACLHTPRIRRS